jgi:hypothetical protein
MVLTKLVEHLDQHLRLQDASVHKFPGAISNPASKLKDAKTNLKLSRGNTM